MDKAEERVYLEKKHARWCASKTVLADLVKRSTGRSPISFDRVVEGHCNEVYFVRTEPTGEFVIRIIRDGESGALEEAWCLRTCAEAGVPVPEVLAVETLETAEGALDAMVLSKLPGRPLQDMLESLSPAQIDEAWREMGKVLRKIHSIRVGGFYKRNPENGQWDFPDWASIAKGGLDSRMAEKPYLVKAGFSEDEIAFLYRIVQRSFSDPTSAQPVLCHGDFLPEHVFFDEAMKVTGVIDFGWYEGASPMRDFMHAGIDYGYKEVGLLRDGYGPSREIDEQFDLRLRLSLVPFHIGVLAHVMRCNEPGAENYVRGLRETMVWLRNFSI